MNVLNFPQKPEKKWFFSFDDGEFGGFFEMHDTGMSVPWIMGPFSDLEIAKMEAICTLKVLNKKAQAAIGYIKNYKR